MIPVITIDGPSGSGKGTVGQILATRLGWHFLDSGALYRITALAMLKQKVSIEDVDKIADLAGNLDVQFETRTNAPPGVILDGEDVSDSLRTETVADIASQVAAIQQVRDALLQKQRAFATQPGLVADGRDMGTRVFPGAKLKIYLTASAEKRAERRYNQLMEKGFDVSLARLLTEIQERDERDEKREISPLRPADDAHVIDSSEINADEVVLKVLELLAEV